MALRFDRGELRKPVTLPGGRLRVDAILTRCGVFEYRNADGSVRREYRPRDEVARADSLATLAGAPLTDDHPAEGEVTTETATKYGRGSVLDTPRLDGTLVAASIVVTDKALIAKIRGGKQELSCGYSVRLDETPGTTPEGEPYDAVQRDIEYNHVALVAVGRAGPQARIRVDSATMISPDSTRGNDMDFEKKYLEQIAETAKATARADTAEAALKAEKARADKLEGERDGAIARADSAEKARNDAASGLDERVQARVALEAQAKGAGVEVTRGMTDRAIKVAVIKKVDRVDVADGKSDDYIAGLFESAATRLDTARANLGGARPGGEQRVDGDDVPPEVAARQKMITEQNTFKGA